MNMRSFDEFEEAHEMRLVRRTSPCGFFYTAHNEDSVPAGWQGLLYVGPAAESRARAFGEIVGACGRWVERRPGLAGWVQVKPVLEVGSDFVAWEFAVAGPSLYSFIDQGDPDELPMEIPAGLPLFLEVVAFFLSDDEDLVRNDPAHQEEEKAAWRSPGGYDAEQGRLEIVRRLLRDSLHEESGATSSGRSWRGDQWEIHSLPVTIEIADRWAELSRY